MYWDNGQLWIKGNVKNGREEGYWVSYWIDGIVNEVVLLGSSIKYKVVIQNDKVLNVSKTSENFDKEIKKESNVKKY